MLEDDGLMESRSGAKSFMIFDSEAVASVRKQLLENDATAIVNSLKQMGLSKEEALELIETYWEWGDYYEKAFIRIRIVCEKHGL